MRITDAGTVISHSLSDLQASWPDVNNDVNDRQSCRPSPCKHPGTDAVAWQSRATQIVSFCGSSRVLTCECLSPNTGGLPLCKIIGRPQCKAEPSCEL